MMRQADVDGDQEIDMAEFCRSEKALLWGRGGVRVGIINVMVSEFCGVLHSLRRRCMVAAVC